MQIEKITSLRFGKEVNGIILDNAYDAYNKNRYISYINENQISYIQSRDVDLRLLSSFDQIEYLTVLEEAEYLEELRCLNKLRGLEITAQYLSEIDLDWFPQLDCLVVHGQPKDKINCHKLRHLYCSQWAMKDLSGFIGVRELKSLNLDYCSKLERLSGLELFCNLRILNLDYCLRLNDIENLAALSQSLNYLSIIDCNRIQNLQVLSKLNRLETLKLLRFQTGGIGKIASLKFIDLLPALHDFTSNYRVEDNDLTPLLRLKEATILNYYKGYNLKEKDLPHS